MGCVSFLPFDVRSFFCSFVRSWVGCPRLVLCGYSTPLAGYLRYRLFFATPRLTVCELCSPRPRVLFLLCSAVCVCVELIVSSLYCLHSVYAILILSIPICKNVLSFVSSLPPSLSVCVRSREVMAYTLECCWGKPLSVCLLVSPSESVSCVSLQSLEIVQRS